MAGINECQKDEVLLNTCISRASGTEVLNLSVELSVHGMNSILFGIVPN